MERDTHGLYDWWSRHPRALSGLYRVAFLGRERRFRRRALAALALTPSERVLELGCGPGNGLAAIRRGVGPNGVVVGLDASRGMVAAARGRIDEAGWRNVHALGGDARHPPVGSDGFDAAYAAMSLSAVSAPNEAVEAVWNALRRGGRFVVLDAQPFTERPWRLANRVVVPVAVRATDWVADVDLVSVLQDRFATVDVATFNAGSIVVARAEKHDE